MDKEKLVRIIYPAMLAPAAALFGLIGFAGFRSDTPLSGDTLQILLMVFSGLTLASVLLGAYTVDLMRRFPEVYLYLIRRSARNFKLEIDSDEERRSRVFYLFIVRGALFETPSVLGFAFGFLGGDFRLASLFFFIAVLCIAFSYPGKAKTEKIRQEDWKKA